MIKKAQSWRLSQKLVSTDPLALTSRQPLFDFSKLPADNTGNHVNNQLCQQQGENTRQLAKELRRGTDRGQKDLHDSRAFFSCNFLCQNRTIHHGDHQNQNHRNERKAMIHKLCRIGFSYLLAILNGNRLRCHCRRCR